MRDPFVTISPAPSLFLRDAAVPAAALALLALVLLTQQNQALFLMINHVAARFPDALWARWTVLGDALLLPVHVLNPWAGEARPPVVLDPAAFHLIGKALRSGSFPSGHTAAAFAFAGVVAKHLRRAWSTALLLVLASGVGLSRMAVGVHWPVDVLAGAAVGWTCASAALVLARRWRWGISPRGQRVTAL